jgi:hypothetical protein
VQGEYIQFQISDSSTISAGFEIIDISIERADCKLLIEPHITRVAAETMEQ